MALRSEDLRIAMAVEAADSEPDRAGRGDRKNAGRQVAMSGVEDEYGVALTLINPFKLLTRLK